MDYYLSSAVDAVEDSIRAHFESAWSRVVGEQPPEYRILVWGSTVSKSREPDDLDLIFEYSSESIGDEKEDSIEGVIQSTVRLEDFSSIDPLVTSSGNVEDIISRSRTSNPYCIDSDEWLEF